MSKAVQRFENAFANYVGARHAVGLVNGTATIHTALVAMGVKPGDRVATTPLTMSAPSLAILHAGAIPVYVDVDPDTWLMNATVPLPVPRANVPVSLYGLHQGFLGQTILDDAAQTLRPHGGAAFTSYSHQQSKILPLGEGGMLCTDSDELAQKARQFSSLGYHMPDGPVIDKAALKHPNYARHHSIGMNYRMAPVVAELGLQQLTYVWSFPGEHYGELFVERLQRIRQECAAMYRDVIQGCDWLTPQHIPEGYTHDMWTFAVATDTPARLLWLLDAMERHGGERPYPAWMLSYDEPALRHLRRNQAFPEDHEGEWEPWPSICPVAEDLQPRLCQFQTNRLDSAQTNAKALRNSIQEAV